MKKLILIGAALLLPAAAFASGLGNFNAITGQVFNQLRKDGFGKIRKTHHIPKEGYTPGWLLRQRENRHRAETVMPAVVMLMTRINGQPVQPGQKGAGQGSGFFTESGLIVSNAHVAGPTGLGSVMDAVFYDGERIPVKVIAFNSKMDVAILAPFGEDEERSFKYLPWAEEEPHRGDPVFAIGAPMGLKDTWTEGQVSRIGRAPGFPEDILQHDASVNPGNSGGPLVNGYGQLVGMNTAIISRVGENNGISIAIRNETIRRMIAIYDRSGSMATARLGVTIAANQDGTKIIVQEVQPRGPAALGGLWPNDVILSVDGAALPDGARQATEVFMAAIRSKAPGETVRIVVDRKGKIFDLEVILGSSEQPRPRI